LLALRLVPALIVGVVVLVTADLARALGGSRGAQVLAAIATGTGAGLLAIGHLLSTATLDLLFWSVVVRLVVAVLQQDRPRLWLVVGAVLGVGLENKDLVGFLGFGLVVGIAATPPVRHHLRSPWAWGGAALAVALWLPNLLWQARNGWPQLELAGDIRDEYGTIGGIAELVLFQVLMINPLGFVLAWIGIRAGLRRPEWAFFRPVPVAYLLLLAVFVVTGGKNYYLLGLLPALAAAGSVLAAAQWSPQRLRRFGVWVAATALFPLPALLPMLPRRTLDETFWRELNEDQLETIGWPPVVGTVRGLADQLIERDGAVVVAQNYGEAGALRWYGVGLPVYSGHNGFGDWGPPPESATGQVIWVGFAAPDPEQLVGCSKYATLRTGVDNEEDGNQAWVCQGPAGSWAQAWTHMRHYSA
jgi:hypothetical protein